MSRAPPDPNVLVLNRRVTIIAPELCKGSGEGTKDISILMSVSKEPLDIDVTNSRIDRINRRSHHDRRKVASAELPLADKPGRSDSYDRAPVDQFFHKKFFAGCPPGRWRVPMMPVCAHTCTHAHVCMCAASADGAGWHAGCYSGSIHASHSACCVRIPRACHGLCSLRGGQ